MEYLQGTNTELPSYLEVRTAHYTADYSTARFLLAKSVNLDALKLSPPVLRTAASIKRMSFLASGPILPYVSRAKGTSLGLGRSGDLQYLRKA